MSVTVKSLLTLEVFQNAILLTRDDTTNRIVKSVSVSDCPVYEDLIDQNIFSYGDFYISSLNLYTNDPDSLAKAIDIMIAAKSSGLCITDEYYESMPPFIVEKCNKANFPMIQISKDITYAQIIRQITESIISDQSYLIKVNTVNELLNGHYTGNEKLNLIQRLNPYFRSCFKVFFIGEFTNKKYKEHFIDALNEHSSWFSIPYSQGILAILSFSETDSDIRYRKFNEMTSYLLDQAYSLGNPVIGISKHHQALHRIDEGIRESLFAMKSSPYTRERILYYDKLGSIRLLIALKDHREMVNYYNLTIKKILDYDASYQQDLFKTLQQYVRNDADYKRTASESNQHENTIRYRINKIRTLLNLEKENIQFYETISIGLKIHDILNL